MINRGEKRQEYRKGSPYWVKRLTNLTTNFVPARYYIYKEVDKRPIPFKEFTHVRFHRAYTKTTMLFELKGMSFGFGNSAWGAPDEMVFILDLGEKVKQENH